MARFRKIDVRTHRDERFRRLSAPQPCGRYLWFHLLTTPSTTNIPGLFSIGEAALAEEIEWSLEGFRKAFREVSGEGMAVADWKARLVWVPKAINYNEPESPNVIRSWRVAWDELPECDLKRSAYRTLKGYAEGRGEAFAKAFQEACAQPSPHPLANQEQEQEQEQEQDPNALSARAREDATDFDRFWSAYPRKEGKAAARKAWRKLSPPLAAILDALAWQCRQARWCEDGGRFVPHPSTYLNGSRWLDEAPARTGMERFPPAMQAGMGELAEWAARKVAE